MKHHLLTSVAVVAALAFSAPVWAQQANPSGGNSMGTPGPNPGGPGLTPYTGGVGNNPGTSALSGPRIQSAPPAAMAPSAMPPPSSMSESSSAMPPSHRHTRAYYHHKNMAAHHNEMARYHRGRANETGGTANQLNQEELQRLQAGNFPPPPPPGMMSPGQPGGARMTPHGTVQ